MARLLVTIPDPLGLGTPNPALLIGAYVRVEIQGERLTDVVPIAERLLRDGTSVWIMNAADELEIRTVEIAWRERDRVCVAAGISPGERIVTSDLSAPVPGMALRVLDETTDAEAGIPALSDEGGDGAGR
jgi:hypothetical protein